MASRTQKDLAREIARQLRISEAKARRFLRLLLDMVADDLVDHGRVELRRLGTFQTIERPAQTITVPRSDPPEVIDVPPYRTVKFRASRRLRERLGPQHLEHDED